MYGLNKKHYRCIGLTNTRLGDLNSEKCLDTDNAKRRKCDCMQYIHFISFIQIHYLLAAYRMDGENRIFDETIDVSLISNQWIFMIFFAYIYEMISKIIRIYAKGKKFCYKENRWKRSNNKNVYTRTHLYIVFAKMIH